jgi:hypothetical protein
MHRIDIGEGGLVEADPPVGAHKSFLAPMARSAQAGQHRRQYTRQAVRCGDQVRLVHWSQYSW